MITNLSNLVQSVNILNSSTGTVKSLYHGVSYLFSSFRSLSDENNFESELDRMNMDRLVKWMGLFFENYESLEENNNNKNNKKNNNKSETETKREYRKELYNVYATIVSDFRQYQEWKKYNKGIWILPYYRSKHTNELAKKIVMDVRLFDEGLSLFSKLE